MRHDQVSVLQDNHWKLILAISRFTSDTESRYTPVEGEALAMVFALDSTRMFTLGNPNLFVGTDHKPLISIMGPKNLVDIKNPRVRSLKEKTLMYSFDIKHVPRIKNKGPDTTLRYPAWTIWRLC